MMNEHPKNCMCHECFTESWDPPPTDQIESYRDNKFRAWELKSTHEYKNNVEKFINEIDNDGYTWELTVDRGWVYVTAVKSITEYVEKRSESLTKTLTEIEEKLCP